LAAGEVYGGKRIVGRVAEGGTCERRSRSDDRLACGQLLARSDVAARGKIPGNVGDGGTEFVFGGVFTAIPIDRVEGNHEMAEPTSPDDVFWSCTIIDKEINRQELILTIRAGVPRRTGVGDRSAIGFAVLAARAPVDGATLVNATKRRFDAAREFAKVVFRAPKG